MESSIKDFKIQALNILALGKNWSFSNDKLTWNETSAQPTDAEIDAKCVELKEEHDALQYQRDRQYPDLGEQLDMLFHDMTAGKGSKTGEWYKAIAKVKADNPKE